MELLIYHSEGSEICMLALGTMALAFVVIDLVKNADLMWKQSVWTSTIAAGLAAEYLEKYVVKHVNVVSIPHTIPI